MELYPLTDARLEVGVVFNRPHFSGCGGPQLRDARYGESFTNGPLIPWFKSVTMVVHQRLYLVP